jgi:hypothetical protein
LGYFGWYGRGVLEVPLDLLAAEIRVQPVVLGRLGAIDRLVRPGAGEYFLKEEW